jgi:hypothetical protein
MVQLPIQPVAAGLGSFSFLRIFCRADEADLDAAVRECPAQPGPALLDVVTDPMELVMPAHIDAKEVFGMTLYSAKAILSGRAGDVLELVAHF